MYIALGLLSMFIAMGSLLAALATQARFVRRKRTYFFYALTVIAGIGFVTSVTLDANQAGTRQPTITAEKELPWSSTWYVLRSPATGLCYEIVSIARGIDSVSQVDQSNCDATIVSER